MKQNTAKRPFIDLSDHLQDTTDSISHHLANCDTYLRVLSSIKLYEIGYYDQNDLDKNLDMIFKNRSKLIKNAQKDRLRRAKISLNKGQIAIWLLEKLSTFAIFLGSILVSHYLL